MTVSSHHKTAVRPPAPIAGFVADLGPCGSTTGPLVARVPGATLLPAFQAADRMLRLCVIGRSTGSIGQRDHSIELQSERWVMGSGCDLEPGEGPSAALGNGVTVEYDARSRSIAVQTSIPGLPAIFVYSVPGRTVLASDVWLLRSWLGQPLQFDPEAVGELLSVGYPLGFKTLFQSVRLVPGGRRAVLAADRGLTISEKWKAPETAAFATSDDYVEFQRRAFVEALHRIPTADAFLSLTAGIDSRTVLAGLIRIGRRLPVRTMSWKAATLDARTAAALCRHYGWHHDVVTFDDSFASELPELAAEASRLSGGLASISQATEIAFYTRSREKPGTRVSGYLGNQIGRGGVESVSRRGCDAQILSDEFRRLCFDRPVESPAPPPRRAHQFAELLDDATLFSVGNYCVGHHFATQESPYATRALIEARAACPAVVPTIASSSALRTRLKDLGHRFAGEPLADSFQRQLLCELGGFVADYPVNWGWRPRGGWSPLGLWDGALTFGDAAIGSKAGADGRLGNIFASLGIIGRHNFRQVHRWCTREYLYDTLTASSGVDGLLDASTVHTTLTRYFEGDRSAFRTLEGALDLMYAARVFTRYQAEVDTLPAQMPFQPSAVPGAGLAATFTA